MPPKYPDHIALMSMKTRSPSRIILSDALRLGGAMCSPEAKEMYHLGVRMLR